VSALEPGLYRATVCGVPDLMMLVGEGNLVHTDSGTYHPEHVTNARPLIVLNLGVFISDAMLIKHLRAPRVWDIGVVADQIEAQCKPARIPEPGWDGKVLAHTENNPTRREFIRYGVRPIPTHFNWNDSLGNGAQQWGDLINPTLIREGVTT
jgi:hypothetical protein